MDFIINPRPCFRICKGDLDMVNDARARTARAGFTLLELMVVASILTIVSGMIYALAADTTRAVLTQESKIVVRDDARIAMQQITRSLRMAIRRTIVDAADNVTQLDDVLPPVVGSISFRTVADVDESLPGEPMPPNGLPVNRDLSIGMSGLYTLTLDYKDSNGDGKGDTQLVLLEDDVFSRVIANNVSPPFPSPDGLPNYYDAPLGGVTFRDLGRGQILVTVITRRRAGPFGPEVVARLDQIVTPRN